MEKDRKLSDEMEINTQSIKDSASITDVSDTKQNMDDLPETFDVWTKDKWEDTEKCQLCGKNFSMFAKRHHW